MGTPIQSIAVTAEPVNEPLTLADVKSHLRIDHKDEDAALSLYISGARQWAESYTHRALINTSFSISYGNTADEFLLPHGKCQSVSSIQYLDTNGAQQTLSAAVYQKDLNDDAGGRVKLAYGQSWPDIRTGQYNSFVINYVAGFGATGASIPPQIQQAMLFRIADMYEVRSTLDAYQQFHLYELGKAAEVLLNPFVLRFV